MGLGRYLSFVLVFFHVSIFGCKSRQETKNEILSSESSINENSSDDNALELVSSRAENLGILVNKDLISAEDIDRAFSSLNPKEAYIRDSSSKKYLILRYHDGESIKEVLISGLTGVQKIENLKREEYKFLKAKEIYTAVIDLFKEDVRLKTELSDEDSQKNDEIKELNKKIDRLENMLSFMTKDSSEELDSSDESEESSGYVDIKVMSFNIRFGSAPFDWFRKSWGNRKTVVVNIIKENNPDIIGFQEVEKKQLSYLSENLPDYDYYSVGRGKNGGDEAVSIFFKKEFFRKIQKNTWWLSDHPNTKGSKDWDKSHPRILSWVRLQTKGKMKKIGRSIDIFNTHWSFNEASARLKSAEFSIKKINEMTQGRYFIYMGDFNAEETDRGYLTLMDKEKIKMEDTFRVMYPKTSSFEGTFHNFDGNWDGPRYDRIFSNIPVVKAHIIRKKEGKVYPSDHFPLTATLRLVQ